MTHSDDFIRVPGARENNLKNVKVETPKRGLTVFTGVSGSGKRALVFATITGESQRLINKTYSAFIQGVMPRPPPPLDSWHRHRTDANPMLGIQFGRLG